jgi:disulfide bond formation protein DsbB
MMRAFLRETQVRWLYLVGVAAIGGLLGFALYLEYVQHLEPCPLCMVQRVAFIALLVLFAIATVHNPGRLGTRIYGGLIVLFALFGVAVAGRHIWIQHLPADKVPACGPGLNYMLDHFPMSAVLKELMHGSGECAAHVWSFLGLGIPEWSVLWYVLLGVWAVFIALRARPAKPQG